ncbi:hypothetical protein JCM21900_004911 [Sporobolomyces salmonicolor]
MVNGNLSHSMRENYQLGVENYYKIVQESYRNPHFPGLKRVLAQLMDTYVENEKPTSIKVLDLAAGSGEATEALLSWKASRWPASPPFGPSTTPTPPASTALPSQPASPAPTPSAPIAPRPFMPPRAVVRHVRATVLSSIPEPSLSITAADPFTSPAYRARTGRPCLELSFAQVAAGELPPPGGASAPPAEDVVELYDLVVVSFALHLVESPSELWALLAALGKRARWLCVTAPHKKPDIKSTWGWRRWDPSSAWRPAEGRGNVGGVEGDGFEIVLDRVRLRLWRSEENWQEVE